MSHTARGAASSPPGMLIEFGTENNADCAVRPLSPCTPAHVVNLPLYTFGDGVDLAWSSAHRGYAAYGIQPCACPCGEAASDALCASWQGVSLLIYMSSSGEDASMGINYGSR